jgi:drug/metabolite transporter (DMT)-like permease
LPIVEIMLLRQIIMLLTVLPMIVRHFPASLRTRHPWHHAARVVFALVGMGCGFTAIVHIPLADATAISFSRTFFITIFAILFLGEVVGVRRWCATIVGFIGVLIMLNPAGDDLNVYGLFAVAGAAGASIVMIIIRYVSRFDSPITILTYQAVFVGLAVAPFAVWLWVWPTLTEWLWIVVIGILSVIGQYANICAYKDGEATIVSSFDYARLLWATLFGLVIFGAWPGPHTLAGAALIVVAAIYTMLREARKKSSSKRSS